MKAEIGGNLDTLSYGAFADCQNLKSIYVKDGLKEIEDNSFYGCSNLAKLRLPDTVSSMSDNAFNNCNTAVYSPDSQYITNYCNSKNIKSSFELGDVYTDGMLTIVDCSFIQMHVSKLFTLNSEQIELADADYDGQVTIQDATFAQMKIAKLL